MNLSAIIFIALGLGIVFGAVLNSFFPTAIAPLDAYVLAPLGKAFLRLIQFVVVPLVFSALILGLTHVRNAAQVGRYMLKLLVSYALTSSVAVCLGMATALFLKPGVGFTGLTLVAPEHIGRSQPLIDWLLSMIPTNPLEALSTGNLLQTIFSAALIGVGIQFVGAKADSFVHLIKSIYAIFEQILGIILYTAPVGVFALIGSAIATQGFTLLSQLAFYMLDLVLAFAIFAVLYAIILSALKINPAKFFQGFLPTFVFAFATASSNAALPLALKNAHEDYGMHEEIASFAIPLGTALKHDGSAIMQSFNALFVAQIYHIPITTELLSAIALSVFLLSYSTPGVPGSGIVMMATVLSAAGLPLEGVAIVAGIDRLIDGFKTAINVLGNLSNAQILARWEEESTTEPMLSSES